ncbi:MAG: hypothetical protein JWQ11_2523 [Rhizobacter sp.]|nr:hypothetical protein [Rhizobacter sp.]
MTHRRTLLRLPALLMATCALRSASGLWAGLMATSAARAQTATSAPAAASRPATPLDTPKTAHGITPDVPYSGLSKAPLQFPRDLGAHPDSRIEWWYITGSLSVAGQAQPYGFQITFFGSRTDVGAGHASRFAARQILFAHAAVSDVAGGKLRHDQRIARAGFGIAESSSRDTDVTLRDWQLRRSGPLTRSLYQARMASDSGRFAYDLQLTATQPLLLQGDAGWSRKGPRAEQASRYYSEPHLAATGTLTLDGKAQAVTGTAWLDHEWSDGLLDADAVGWDWIGMNLGDGSALTAFQVRRKDGSAVWAGGSHRTAAGVLRNFGPQDVSFEAGRRWTSPSTSTAYPVLWTVRTPAGAFVVAPLLDNQELDSRNSTGTVYWEGLSELRDLQGGRVGSGYLEMTGYVSALKL